MAEQGTSKPKGGHAARNAGIIIIVLLFLFFFIPIVPYSSTSTSIFGISSTKVTGQMSPSFYMFGCGIVLNLQGSGTVFGVQTSQSQSVSGFFCNAGTAH